MKKYLFGLGAMLVGAGLMFVLMQGEVSAEWDKDEKRFRSQKTENVHCELIDDLGFVVHTYVYCKIKDLTCVSATNGGLSCVKS